MANFGDEVTGAGTGWQNLLDILIANGYTGFAIGSGNIAELAGALVRLKWGHTSRTVAPVSSSDGFPIDNATEEFTDVDAALAWVYFPSAVPISIKFNNAW